MFESSRNRSQVFASIALVLLLGGVGLVVGLFLRRDESLRRCQSNLQLLTMAAANYHDTHNHWPLLIDLGPDAATGRGITSGFALLSPHIAVSHAFYAPDRNSDLEYYAHSTQTFARTWKFGEEYTQHGGYANARGSFFTDPADAQPPLRDVPRTLPDGVTGYYATGSYVLNGLLPRDLPLDHAPRVLIAERPQVCGDVHNLWGVGFYDASLPTFALLGPDEARSTQQFVPVLPLPEVEQASLLRLGFRTATPVAGMAPFQRVTNECDPRRPGTYHRQGMPVAMTDGSVRVLSGDMSAWVFWSLCVPDTAE